MTREQFDKLYKSKAVLCKDMELTREFVKMLESVGYKGTGSSLLRESMFKEMERYEDEIVFFVEDPKCWSTKRDFIADYMNDYELVEFVSLEKGQEEKKEEQETTYEGTMKAIIGYLGVKDFILQLEKAQKIYWEKMYKSTDEDTSNFYRGMEHCVLACINDLKRILGDENE